MIKKSKAKLTVSLIFLIVILVVIVFLKHSTVFSYGSFKSVASIETNTKHSISMHYLRFKGYKFAILNLKDGDELNLNVKIKTKKGNLKVSLIDENDKELFKTENPKEEINKIVKINKDGKYKLKIEGDHKGSCKISWNIRK